LHLSTGRENFCAGGNYYFACKVLVAAGNSIASQFLVEVFSSLADRDRFTSVGLSNLHHCAALTALGPKTVFRE
jgi:hypothetical protein